MRADRQRGGAAGRGDVGPRESFRLETKDAPETPSALRKERENAGFDGSVGCSRSTPDSPRTVSPAGKPRLWTRVCVKGSPLRDKGRSSKSGLAPPGLLHTHTHTHICTVSPAKYSSPECHFLMVLIVSLSCLLPLLHTRKFSFKFLHWDLQCCYYSQSCRFLFCFQPPHPHTFLLRPPT